MAKLTDSKVKQFKYDGKPRKIFDGGGLYLYLTKSGKLWRYKYRYHKKEKVLALGAYPVISLSEARRRHKKARKQHAQGLDPSHQKKIEKHQKYLDAQVLFKDITWEWFATRPWSENHRKKQRARIENDILPILGNLPIKEIGAHEILIVCRVLQDRGVIDGAH